MRAAVQGLKQNKKKRYRRRARNCASYRGSRVHAAHFYLPCLRPYLSDGWHEPVRATGTGCARLASRRDVLFGNPCGDLTGIQDVGRE